MPGLQRSDLEEIFQYHAPSGVTYEKLRASAKDFAQAILELVPAGPDQTVAIRHVRDAVMTANAAVALHGKY